MAKQGLTEISAVLDRSGSMQVRKSDTIGGFNAFLDEQQKLPGECTVSLYQFDDRCESVYEGVSVDRAPRLTDTTFVPRGSTALLDAIGRTINAVGARLASLPEEDRPEKILIVIQTDGQENSSKEFNSTKVKEMVNHQRDNCQWQFIFLGADENSFDVSASIGIAMGQTLAYTASNMIGAINTMSNYAANFRGATKGAQVDFTDEDRKAASEPAKA